MKLTTNQAWQRLFDRFSILERVDQTGCYRIAASAINEYREARLMTKFDSSAQLPDIFKSNDLTILPLTRGDYSIGRYRAYQKLAYPATRAESIRPPVCQSLRHTDLYSESSALSFAFNSGILARVAGTAPVLFTVNGRMSSGVFPYLIDDCRAPLRHRLLVKNAQIEIDGGYESADALYLVEAKNSAAEDFLVRQLYYPYRLWSEKVAKPVIPVFMVFSNDIFTFFVFTVGEREHYNSLELTRVLRFTAADEAIAMAEIRYLAYNVHCFHEPHVQLPQANSFERVVDLLSILVEGPLSAEEVTARYGFDPRQTRYYADACRYLGLLEKYTDADGRHYRLTADAQSMMRKKTKEKTLGLIRAIVSRPVFNRALRVALETGRLPDNEQLAALSGGGGAINPTTAQRRFSTVRKWVEWILGQGN